MNSILDWEKHIFIFLNNLGCEPYDAFWLFLSERFTWIPTYFLLLLIVYHTFGTKTFFRIIIFIFITILISDQLTSTVFRPLIARPRPCHDAEILTQIRLLREGCGGAFGFWSAHASNAFALAVFLGNIFYKKYKYAIYLLLIWASLVAYSRIYIGVHLPFDIIAGAIFGSLIGYSMYKIFSMIFPYYHIK